jgi:AraC family transcriptional regulator
MQVEIRKIEPRKAVCMSHRGAYPTIGRTCEQLGAWIRETGAEVGTWICLYYDDPKTTPAEELQSDAGAYVSADFATDDPRVHVVDVPAGTYAVSMHVGPYEGIPASWMELVDRWRPSSGYALGCGPFFEVYVDDCVTTPQDRMRTELYAPVKASAE